MRNGKTFTLSTTVTPLTSSNTGVTFESSDTSIATVDANGKVTVLKEGNVIITVKSKDNTNLKATCIINATKHVDVTDFTIKDKQGNTLTEENALELKEGITTKVNITGILPTNATYENEDFEWSSSNENIVKVSNGKIYAVPQSTQTETEGVVENSQISRTATITVRIKKSNNEYVTKTFKVLSKEISLWDINIFSNEYEITEDNVIIVPLKTTISTFLDNISILTDYGINIKLIDLQYIEIADESKFVGTGMRLAITTPWPFGEGVYVNIAGEPSWNKTYSIIVKGDTLNVEETSVESSQGETFSGKVYKIGNGKLDAQDLVAIRNYATGLDTYSSDPIFALALDINENGEIADAADIAILSDAVLS